jgi:hypothetical protein
MNNALTFGIPHRDPKLCFRPECRELADFEVTVIDRDTPMFTCRTHLGAATHAFKVKRLRELKAPGDVSE